MIDVIDAISALRRIPEQPRAELQQPAINLLDDSASQSPLPPGPSAPSMFQTMAWWNRPLAFLERSRARYGRRFTIRLLGIPPERFGGVYLPTRYSDVRTIARR